MDSLLYMLNLEWPTMYTFHNNILPVMDMLHYWSYRRNLQTRL